MTIHFGIVLTLHSRTAGPIRHPFGRGVTSLTKCDFGLRIYGLNQLEIVFLSPMQKCFLKNSASNETGFVLVKFSVTSLLFMLETLHCAA